MMIKQLRDPNFYTVSVISLIAVNFIVLILALLFEWSFFQVIFTFWIENVVIGIYNIPKILMTKGKDDGQRNDTLAWRIATVLFFLFHYSIFTALHGFLLIIIFYNIAEDHDESFKAIEMLDVIVLSAVTYFISHGISFFTNYVKKKEFKKHTAMRQMILPYKRVFLVHGFIFLGSFLILFVENGMTILMIVFILIKTGIDLFSHHLSHSN